ncbi:MAG: hypothetical protein ABSG31_04285 [Tepidisphaeraceae bacterium]|jgi:hypothetical protein
MSDTATPLSQISMVAANFGYADSFADALEDWFNFLGGKPGEVVVVDGGSDAKTQAVYWQLFQVGKIDKLQVIRKDHPDNHRDLCFVQEHTAGAIASKPYLLWFKTDALPFRKGHDDWLTEAFGYLERPDTFAIGGAFNIPSKHHDSPWPGWYFSDKCSENFALMKRSIFIEAMEEFAGNYIASGFRGENPAETTRQARYLVEVAFERYIQAHQKFTLVRVEDPTWTVFHTNATNADLPRVRKEYLARRNIEKFLNQKTLDRYWGGCFYGKPPKRWERFKWFIGDSPLGPAWKFVKRLLGAKPASAGR